MNYTITFASNDSKWDILGCPFCGDKIVFSKKKKTHETKKERKELFFKN